MLGNRSVITYAQPSQVDRVARYIHRRRCENGERHERREETGEKMKFSALNIPPPGYKFLNNVIFQEKGYFTNV